MNEVEQAWAEYTEALERLSTATKLVAFHTKECSEAANRVALQASIAVWHIKEVLAGIREKIKCEDTR